jgi:hypothetical protein
MSASDDGSGSSGSAAASAGAGAAAPAASRKRPRSAGASKACANCYKHKLSCCGNRPCKRCADSYLHCKDRTKADVAASSKRRRTRKLLKQDAAPSAGSQQQSADSQPAAEYSSAEHVARLVNGLRRESPSAFAESFPLLCNTVAAQQRGTRPVSYDAPTTWQQVPADHPIR